MENNGWTKVVQTRHGNWQPFDESRDVIVQQGEITNMEFFNYIKNMSKEEMNNFIYWIYCRGHEDCKNNLMDDEYGFFGQLANLDCKEVFKTCLATNSDWLN